MITLQEMRDRLRAGAEAISAAVRATSEREARWKPTPDRWSVLEIVNHLADEEIEDFRRRLELVLADPGAPWPAIDPPRAVVERRYNERDLAESLGRFAAERERSLDWLSRLPEPDWNLAHAHPSMGSMTAGTLAVAWVGHDLLHVRQIAKVHWDFLSAESAPHSIGYAGNW